MDCRAVMARSSVWTKRGGRNSNRASVFCVLFQLIRELEQSRWKQDASGAAAGELARSDSSAYSSERRTGNLISHEMASGANSLRSVGRASMLKV
jgi:hypothetical protein